MRSTIDPELETVNEIARRFRMDKSKVLAAATMGQVRCCRRIMRGGREGYLIEVADARRLWGAS